MVCFFQIKQAIGKQYFNLHFGTNMKENWETKEFEDCLDKVVYTNKIMRKDFLEDGSYPIISQEQEFINRYW